MKLKSNFRFFRHCDTTRKYWLLDGDKSVVVSRIVCAFTNIDRPKIVDDILNGMKAEDYNVREVDPFTHKNPITFSQRQISPYVNRMELIRNEMRKEVIKIFPPT
jgi:hypothetical protein